MTGYLAAVGAGQVAGVRAAFCAACAGYVVAHLPVVLSPRIRQVA
ncbi:hypothetical protein [Planotetraspora sp. GP83]